MEMKGFKSTQAFPPAWVSIQAKQIMTMSDMQWEIRIKSYSFKLFHKPFLREKKAN